MPVDPESLTIAEAERLLREKELTSVELTEAYLARIDALNPDLNAYVLVTAERALADARQADEAFAAGIDRGPLHGVPIGLKDLYETEGVRTTGGSIILKDFIPGEDCTAAAKLREAGSVLLGKLNTHEWAWGTTTNNHWYGATKNPWDTSRIPGGSSGGSGAAIAASLAAGTLGTDTGGSIRIPASLCGCAGLKPTFGRVSKRGVLPMSQVFDHPGPITRTVEDAAIMLSVIAGYDARDPMTVPMPVEDYREKLAGGVRGLHIGIPRQFFWDVLDPEVAASIEVAITTLRELGAEVRDVPCALTREQANRAFLIVFAESAAYHGANFKSRPQDFSPQLQGILSTPLPDAAGLAHALDQAYDIRTMFREMLEEVDLLLTPTCMTTAAKIGGSTITVAGHEMPESSAFAGLTMPFNATGLPVLSLPCGFSASGMPIGMSLAGRPFAESTVLRAGHAYEQATGWHLRRPTLPA